MVVIFWIVNFIISWANAWGCGMSWTETKTKGGFPHFMNWISAIMSACGFTWCYLIVLAFLGATVPFEQDGKEVFLLTMEEVRVVLDLGYLVIIGPILGSGLAITLNSWRHFYQKQSIQNGLATGYNSLAQAYNYVSALEYVPEVVERVGSFFANSGSKGKKKGGFVIILIVAIAVIGGILTTRAIILSTARKVAFNRQQQLEAEQDLLRMGAA